MKQTRRDLLRYSACGLLGRAAFLSGFDRFSMVSAMAAPVVDATDYKALVCIFMFGGNDANNMIVPLDNYANYATNRGVLALPQAQLLQITSKGLVKYGLHPNLGSAQPNQASLYSLFQSGAVAVVSNVGTLTAPIQKADYLAGTRPNQLFSHSDQQAQWQTSISTASSATGWGGRIADVTKAAGSAFPAICSVAGVSVFSQGASTQPLAIAPAPTPLNQTLRLVKPDTAIQQILTVDQSAAAPTLVHDSDNITQFALNNSALLSTNPTLTTTFPATGLGNQLNQVAKLISLRASLGIKRQIFFCSIGGFDTHTVQLSTQVSLLQQLSDAMAAFYNATRELGVSSQVTSFTLSDFSRTFKPAGSAAATVGSDHAWGSHHFVMGDSVKGGDFYGMFPDLAVGGSQDADSGAGARGRWIPTTSVDEYAATLALWYGLANTDLPLAFPNIGRFATTNLGFMM
jgi:uncharacterized protein (DUF1501 family)